MLTPATCWYLVFTFCLDDFMNSKQMNGARYEIHAGRFKGRSSGDRTGVSKRILIMENDSYLAMLMLFQLTRAGFDTDVVRTGKEGLALVQTEQFDLIAFDLDLPEATHEKYQFFLYRAAHVF
jgi:PleD family two-component response regulator